MPEMRLRAMNTDILLLAVDESDAPRLASAAQQFARYERALSRFDPESELSALNRAPSGWVAISPLLFDALALAESLRTETAGLFNPAVLPALEAAGYDRSFELLALEPCGQPAAARPADGVPVAPEPYALDATHHRVRLAPGARLDLGGIGKGLAVDAAARELAETAGFLVDAGGDIRVGGRSPTGPRWGIAVQDPTQLDRDLLVLAVSDTAVATSSVARRRWQQGGAVRHHLIDPRTGQSATSDLLAATVLASSCARAEVWAKAVVIAGRAAGETLLAAAGLAGVLVDTAGRAHVNAALRPQLVRDAE